MAAPKWRPDPLVLFGLTAYALVIAGMVSVKLSHRPHELAMERFRDGQMWMDRGDWEMAAQAFEMAAADHTMPFAAAALEDARREQQVARQLDTLERQFGRYDIGTLATSLRAIPDETRQTARREQLHQRIEKSADDTLLVAKSALRRNERDSAKQLASAVLQVRPRSLEAHWTLAAANDWEDAWLGGLMLYADGAHDAALRLLARCTGAATDACVWARRDLQLVQKQPPSLFAEDDDDSSARASRSDARELGSSYGRSACYWMFDAIADENYLGAARLADLALKEHAADPCGRIVHEAFDSWAASLSRVAVELVDKNPDRAVELFRNVEELTLPASTLHVRAREQIKHILGADERARPASK